LYLLILWQVCVLLVAVTGSVLSGRINANVVDNSLEHIESNFQPSQEDVQEARELFEQRLNAHFEQFGKPQTRDQNTAVDEWGIPLSIGPPPMRAVEAINRGIYQSQLVNVVLTLPTAEGHEWDSVWEDLARNAAAIVWFVEGRYSDAAELFAGEHARYAKEFEAVREALQKLEAKEGDFINRLAFIRAVERMSHSAWLSRALCDQYWRLGKLADGDAEQAQILLNVQLACVSGYAAPPWTWRRETMEAACRLLAAQGPENTGLIAAIAALADLEADRGDNAVAEKLFEALADRFPNAPDWGRYVFNAGFLQIEHGSHRQGIATLQRIFPSGVNDLQPGSHLMEPYRNYQHKAAVQVTEGYKGQWNYPMAYIWCYRASFRYSYRSWCGTCVAGVRRAQSRRLFVASLQAGPAFLIANFLAAPRYNWKFIVLGGMAGSLLIWRRRRRRAAIVTVPRLG
jgi:tetratricopeptide (TPR) repeat protein